MAAKKSRKRAYIPPSHEVVNRRERAERTITSSRTAARPGRGSGSARAQYEYPVPSMKRTLRRLPVYFVLIFALQAFLQSQDNPDLAMQKLLLTAMLQAAIVTIVFAPFMHLMDRFAYNRHQKRIAAAAARSKGA